ncbi:hypothetical protein AM501_05410 [Aneurinibacillus migulanus]|nr:hypothetical protein TS64_04205 [Aneurinibacillus migulanus]KPD09271.1 hypothetical protein AM501_05410 [Aneurinibacillus migulanus]
MFYNHMKVLVKIDQFRKLNNRERRIADFYDYHDVLTLHELFNNINTEGQVAKFKKSLFNFWVFGLSCGKTVFKIYAYITLNRINVWNSIK